MLFSYREVQESYTAFLTPDSGSAEAKAWVANTKSVEKVFNDLSEGLKVSNLGAHASAVGKM